jgi:nitroreductase
MTTLEQIMARRRSVRRYDPTKGVSRQEIETLVAAALEAPTWKNSETGRYYIATSDEMKAQAAQCLAPQNQPRAEGCAAIVVTTFVENRAGFNREGMPDNELGNGWGIYDLGLQSAFLLLKAAEMGIDSLVIGLRDADALRQLFAIPEGETVVSVIVLGHRAEEPQRPKRKDVADVAHFC